MPPCLRNKTSLKGWQDYRQAVSEAQPPPQGIMTKARMGGRTLQNDIIAFLSSSPSLLLFNSRFVKISLRIGLQYFVLESKEFSQRDNRHFGISSGGHFYRMEAIVLPVHIQSIDYCGSVLHRDDHRLQWGFLHLRECS